MSEPSNEKLIFFLYARKSSEGEDRQVQSIDDQLNRLRELASRSGFVIKAEFTEAKSAKKPHVRPVFAEMLKRIERGEANAILSWELNRLTRNPIDSGTLSWLLQQGILRCIQTIDRKYLPDDNVLLFSVESGMANQFIIDLRKNCKRGMVGKAERGWLPSLAPLGYINDKLDRSIKPDPQRFALVRKMWDLMLSGVYNPEAIRIIATEQWGLRTTERKRRGNQVMCTSLMYKMFSNIFYTGLFEWNGKLYEGKHKPMISMDEYDKVQFLLGRDGKPRAKTHAFAYTGLIRCATCGSMITATEKTKLIRKTGQLKTYVYYHCTRKNPEMRCSNAPINVAELEEQIEAKLKALAILPQFKEWADIALAEGSLTEDAEKIKIHETREAALQKTEREITGLVQMRYKGLIDDDRFVEERDALQVTIMKLKHQLTETERYSKQKIVETRRAFQFIAHAHETFKNASLHEKKQAVIEIGSNYTVSDKKLLFEKAKWLVPLEKAYPALEAEYLRLELDKNVAEQERNEVLRSIFLRWCSIVEDVSTAFLTKNNSEIHTVTLHSENNSRPP